MKAIKNPIGQLYDWLTEQTFKSAVSNEEMRAAIEKVKDDPKFVRELSKLLEKHERWIRRQAAGRKPLLKS